MQVTYTLPADSLNENFIEKVKDNFAGKNVNITIEDISETTFSNQAELFKKMENLRKKIGHVKIDPGLDLSALANDVNL